MTLGDEFISELKRRRGLDFKWRELQSLHGVETLEALSGFLASQGYPEVPVSRSRANVDPAQVAEVRVPSVLRHRSQQQRNLHSL